VLLINVKIVITRTYFWQVHRTINADCWTVDS